MKLNEENVNFIHTANIKEEKLCSYTLALAIIPTSDNSQANVKNVKICFQSI